MISVSVNMTSGRKIRGDLAAYRVALNKLVENLVVQEGCLTARAAIKFTPPLTTGSDGDTANAGRVGAVAVDRDVRAVVKPGDSSLKAAVDPFYGDIDTFEKWRARPIPKTSNIIIRKIHADEDVQRAFDRAVAFFKNLAPSRFLGGEGAIRQAHEAERKAYRGRITRNRGPSDAVRRSPFFADPRDIDAYVKKRQMMVGRMKSAWWRIIDLHGRGLMINGRLVNSGAKGLPRYVTRHSSDDATSVLRKSPRGPSFSIRNAIGNAMDVGTDAKTMEHVLTYRRNQRLADDPDKHLRRFTANWNRGNRTAS